MYLLEVKFKNPYLSNSLCDFYLTHLSLPQKTETTGECCCSQTFARGIKASAEVPEEFF